MKEAETSLRVLDTKIGSVSDFPFSADSACCIPDFPSCEGWGQQMSLLHPNNISNLLLCLRTPGAVKGKRKPHLT